MKKMTNCEYMYSHRVCKTLSNVRSFYAMSASPRRGRSHCELEDKVKTLEVRQTGIKSTLGRKSTENTKVSEELNSAV